MIADRLGGNAGGIGGADQRAEAASGDDRGLDTQLVEDFEHRDMGEAAGRAAAEGQPDPRSAHAPAFSAKRQAVSRQGPDFARP